MYVQLPLRDSLETPTAAAAMNRQKFRNFLRQMDAARLDTLDAWYYPVMVDIPGGKDTLGSDDPKDSWIFYWASPSHPVTLSSFKIAKTETIWWQYFLYCTATGKAMPEKPAWGYDGDNPVINVSWYDAVEYANWVNKQKGLPAAMAMLRL